MAKSVRQRKSPKQRLWTAVANGLVAEAKELLAQGADPNGLPGKGGPLHFAVRRRHLGLLRLLLAAGADLNVRDDLDLTPLMCACSRGGIRSSRIAMELIRAGADVTYVREGDGMTALKFAAGSCTAEVLQALIDCGAEVDGPPGTDQTALMLAARGNDVEGLKVLVRNGADVARPCGLPWADGCTAEGLAEMEGGPEAVAYLRRVRQRKAPGR